MKFSWEKCNKVISSLVVVSFISSLVLPAVVLAEEAEKQIDSSTAISESTVDSSMLGNSESDASSDSVLDENKESNESVMIDSSIDMESETSSETADKAESEQSKGNDSSAVISSESDEITSTGEATKESDTEAVDETETQAEENSEEVFSLEDYRAEAMKILNELQGSTSQMMMARSLPYTTQFIYDIASSAVKLGNENGLYPSVMIAQAILETAWGKSTLSAPPNYNLFGIKGSYNGNSVRMLTSEYTEDGNKIQIYDNFKKYPSYKESFQDYADFIRNTKGITRYAKVWRENAPTYQDATAGLVSGGYATDPAYATSLNDLIRFNQLDRYDKNPSVTYSTHIQDTGWLSNVSNGNTSGTTGKSKRMESVKINLKGFDNLNIQYSSHVQDKGWLDWVSDGSISGTTGQNKRMEAIKIKLFGLQAANFDVYYRVHAENEGWLGWAKNGESSGTAGYGLRLEALQIKIVPKGSKAPGTTQNAYLEKVPNINYSTHVKNKGWLDRVSNGKTSGTIGEVRRIEGITVELSKLSSTGDVLYRSHVQDYGWGIWVSNGALSGTIGKAKRIEAIQLKLSGELETKYDIYYRAHVQDYGWLGWAKNGASAGTEGLSKQMEAIEIKLVKKGAAAPGNTMNVFVK
ncbi:glucosaminidase domain-containing protein [Carnobacterium mobile]|uniref:glucosaminidase domain-containing protein n=1 Tax=Carnobacterium mobile TaxID=2750 RepID=UPI001868803F|nr:glucosaminidase domain-containing protein [Carnobacterium mobile]